MIVNDWVDNGLRFYKIRTQGLTWVNHEPVSVWEDVYINPRNISSVERILENSLVRSVIIMSNGQKYRVEESLEVIVTAIS